MATGRKRKSSTESVDTSTLEPELRLAYERRLHADKFKSGHDMWIEFFQEGVGHMAMIAVEGGGRVDLKILAQKAGELADEMLEVYERRWGK